MARLKMKDIAVLSGVSYSRVYQLKQKLGRTPTIEEVLERKGHRGAPTKDLSKQFVIKFVGNKKNFKAFIEHLVEIYGENTTLGEIVQKIGALDNVNM